MKDTSGLLSKSAQAERIAQKRRMILTFLRDETWTHASVLQSVLNVKTSASVYRTLKPLLAEQMIVNHHIQMPFQRSISLYGITSNGLAHAWELGEAVQKRQTFQPSKVNPLTMQHKFDLQLLRTKASHFGYSNWVDGSHLGWRKSGYKIPDAITIQSTSVVAIELERTVKSRKNYAEVLCSHLKAIKNKRYHEVHYWSPTVDLMARVERAIKSIQKINISGQWIEIEPRHFTPFKFFNYGE